MKGRLFRRAATVLAGGALLLCSACAEWAMATSWNGICHKQKL